MNPERRLREHLAATAAGLSEPSESLAEVVRRGRRRRAVQTSAVALAAVAAVFVVAGTWRSFDRTTIEFDPAAPPTEATPTATATPDTAPTPGQQDGGESLSVSDLGAPVLASGPYDHDQLRLIDGTNDRVLVPGPVDVVLPDGRGGVVHQPASQEIFRWVGTADDNAPPSVEVQSGQLQLRTVLPDGRVVYSVRSVPDDEELAEPDDNAVEEFFAIAPTEDADPEQLGTRPLYESSTVGPAAAADGQLVYAACHLHCRLWAGLDGPAPDADPLYDGLAIEGLTSTPDGRIIGFVEYDHMLLESGRAPQLVLLDGASFAQLARVDVPPGPDSGLGGSMVSLSADAQRVLVTLGGANGRGRAAYLVRDALTPRPEVLRVDFEGGLQWFDPVRAVGRGMPAGAAEQDIAERFMAFAAKPGPDTLDDVGFAAEVLLGLGPDIVGGPRPREDLAQPGAWTVETPSGLFRAAVGPFSALEQVRSFDEVLVTRGPHAHCASPPVPVPSQLEGLDTISIQDVGGDSCLQWGVVDLFVDDTGDIVGVTVDFWEP